MSAGGKRSLNHITEEVVHDKLKNDTTFDFVNLPANLFPHEDIPPPLVSKSWFNSIELFSVEQQSDDYGLSEEDIPLSVIIELWRTVDGKTQDKTQKDERYEAVSRPSKKRFKVKSSQSKSKKLVLISRRRGRPKKNSAQNSSDILYKLCKNLEISTEKLKENFDSINIKGDVGTDDASLDFWNENSQESNQTTEPERDSNQTVVPPTFTQLEKTIAQAEIVNNHDYAKSPLLLKKSRRRRLGTEKLSPVKRKKEAPIVNFEAIVKDEKKLIYPCNECGKTFSARSTLKNHSKLHSGKLHMCPECNQGFITNYLLKCHIRIHTGDLFMCHTCGKGFTTPELLKVHDRGHTGERPFVCDVCNKGFPSASNLQQHKEIHNSEKKYLCSECGASFYQKRCLDGHMQSHGDKPHVCTACGKHWTRKSDLIEHMRVHTGSKPYECDKCFQRFTQASSLRRHKAMTHDDRVNPFVCSICNKKFKSEAYYNKHTKKHIPVQTTAPNESIKLVYKVSTTDQTEIINVNGLEMLLLKGA